MSKQFITRLSRQPFGQLKVQSTDTSQRTLYVSSMTGKIALTVNKSGPFGKEFPSLPESLRTDKKSYSRLSEATIASPSSSIHSSTPRADQAP